MPGCDASRHELRRRAPRAGRGTACRRRAPPSGTSMMPDARSGVGHPPGDDPLRQPLDDRGLADAGRAEQHRVALRRSGRATSMSQAVSSVAADDRRERALGGELRSGRARSCRAAASARRRRGDRRRGRRPAADGGARRPARRRPAAIGCGGDRAGRRATLAGGRRDRAGVVAGQRRGPARRLGQLVEVPLEPAEREVEAGRAGAARSAASARPIVGHQWTRSRSSTGSAAVASGVTDLGRRVAPAPRPDGAVGGRRRGRRRRRAAAS